MPDDVKASLPVSSVRAFFASPRTQDEVSDHMLGFRAGTAKGRQDKTQTDAWQRGWLDSQDS
jgi:hypothetical protein